jgi:hypothetical protein
MISIPKTDSTTHPSMKADPGGLSWQIIAYPRARRTAWCEVTCPSGHGSSLNKAVHTISGDGIVNPSIICSHEGCTFHEFARLSDWKPEYADENAQ